MDKLPNRFVMISFQARAMMAHQIQAHVRMLRVSILSFSSTSNTTIIHTDAVIKNQIIGRNLRTIMFSIASLCRISRNIHDIILHINAAIHR